jgi:hypothetical protein
VIHPEAHSSCHLEKQQLPQVAEIADPIESLMPLRGTAAALDHF